MYAGIFDNQDPQFKNHIKCAQLGTVRFEQGTTPNTVTGLSTDGLSACVGLVVISQNRQKISLTHTDLAVKPEAVALECRWAGSGCQLYVIKGMNYTTVAVERQAEFPQVLTSFKQVFTAQGLHVEMDTSRYFASSGAVAVNSQGRITTPFEAVRIGNASPNHIEFRHTINMINAYALIVQRKLHPLDLQYDSAQWTPIPSITLAGKQLMAQATTSFLMGDIRSNIAEYQSTIKAFKLQSKTLTEQAVSAYQTKNFQQAASLFHRVLKLQLLIRKGSDNRKTLIKIFSNLSGAEKNSGEFNDAIQHLQQAVNLSIEVFGADHTDTVTKQKRLEEYTQHIKVAPQL